MVNKLYGKKFQTNKNIYVKKKKHTDFKNALSNTTECEIGR